MKEILIVGAGISGLMVADRLSSVGYKTKIVEQESKIASGPSSRNGGYVHGGGFHAGVIDDEVVAQETAIQCKLGLERIKAEFPFACQNASRPIHLFVKCPVLAQKAQIRWQKFGIRADPITKSEFKKLFPHIRSSMVAHAVEVNDTPINYALVYQFILTRLKQRGVKILKKSFFDRSRMEVVSSTNEKHRISNATIVYCCGAHSKDLFQDRTEEFRLWKSHVVLAPKIDATGFNFIDPREVSVMHQGEYCVVCQSQEDTLVADYDYDILADKVTGIGNALENVMPSFSQRRAETKANACLKPSIHRTNDLKRNRDIYLNWHSEFELVALPGKATLAPSLADMVLQKIYEKSHFPDIALRSGEKHLDHFREVNRQYGY